MLDGDGIAVEVIFPDGITENNSLPFDAGLGLGTEGVEPELQWAGARARNRWLSELCSITPGPLAPVFVGQADHRYLAYLVKC